MPNVKYYEAEFDFQQMSTNSHHDEDISNRHPMHPKVLLEFYNAEDSI